MIVTYRHEGQLCNRLWALLPLLSYSIHRKMRLLYLFPYDSYLQYFPLLSKSKYIKFFRPSKYLYPIGVNKKIQMFLNRWDVSANIDLRNFYPNQKICCLDGWDHSHDQAFIFDHKEELVCLFNPPNNVRNYVNSFFENGTITIGLHIRRGDYKTYCKGIYYYDDIVWQKIMRDMKKQFGDKVRFLICSNERVSFVLNNQLAFSIPDSNPIIDLFALSKCDYIVGPPSSFSQWASFIGGIPLRLLLSANDSVDLRYFSPIIALDTFKDGTVLRFDKNNEIYKLG